MCDLTSMIYKIISIVERSLPPVMSDSGVELWNPYKDIEDGRDVLTCDESLLKKIADAMTDR